MQKLLIVVLLLAPAYASKCGEIKTCYECNAATDSSGSEYCSWCGGSSHCVGKSSLDCIFSGRISHKDDCPIPIPNNYEFNETLARDVMVPLCSAAYSNYPQTCLDNRVHNAKLYRQITLRCETKDDLCSGFTAVSDYYKAIIIAFRGSLGTVQLVIEGAETIFAKKIELIGGGKVSDYFYKAFNKVWEEGKMMEDVLTLRKTHPTYEIWITGHSLGGAMASIAANVIVRSNICPGEQVKLVTFGQPRTGNREFAKLHDQILPYNYRITHRKDLVPHLPTKDFEDYHHHRYEVWYDNDMKKGDTGILCLAPEDSSCSDANLIDYSVEDHLHYYNKPISTDFSCTK